MQVNINQLKQVIYQFVQKKKPLYIHGTIGIGKSFTVEAIAKRMAKERNKPFNDIGWEKDKYNFMDLRASQLDPSDVRGIPFPDNDTTRWLPPGFFPQSPEMEGIIFVDEMNLAMPTIQSSFYQLIHDRRIGEYILPENVVVMAAGNLPSDNAATFPMADPLKNRFGHVTLIPPSDQEWTDWAMQNDVSLDVIAFIAFKPSYLHKHDKETNDNAFPTHRTVTNVSYTTEGLGVDDIDLQYLIAAAWCGQAWASEYQAFLKLKERIKLDDVLNNPEKVRELDEIDLKWSLISGLAERYKQDRRNMEKIVAVAPYLEKEFAMFMFRLMKGTNPNHFANDIQKTSLWIKGNIREDFGVLVS